MYSGVNNNGYNLISSSDLCGQKVLGINGSLKNWINTGSVDVIETSNNKKNNQKQAKKANFASFLKGIVIALAGVSAGALLLNGKKFDFSKIQKYFSEAFSSFKASNASKLAQKEGENIAQNAADEAENIKKAAKKFQFPKIEIKKPEFKFFNKIAKKTKASDVEGKFLKQKEKTSFNFNEKFQKISKLKNNLKIKFSNIFQANNHFFKKNKLNNNPKKTKKTFKDLFASFSLKSKKTNKSAQIPEQNPISKVKYSGNPNVRRSIQTKAQILEKQELEKFDIEDIIAEFSDKTPIDLKYTGSAATRKSTPTMAELLKKNDIASNAVEDVIADVAEQMSEETIENNTSKVLYSANPKTRKNTLTRFQKQEKELEKFNIEDIIAEFSNKLKNGDEIEIQRGNDVPLILKYQIDEAGNQFFYEPSEMQPFAPVYSQKHLQKMEAKRLKDIEDAKKHLTEALNYTQEEISSKLQKIKDFGYGFYEFEGKNGFDKDIVVSKKMIDELEQVGFPFNVKPNDILEALEIEDISENECYRILFNPNPRFKIGDYKLNPKDLQTLVGITKKPDGTLAFIYV